MSKVQAFITNISFPKKMDEFIDFLEDNFHFDVDDVLTEKYVQWTAPNWCKVNDIVFFMHAKTAIATIRRLKTKYLSHKNNYTNQQQILIESGIEHAMDNYRKYGGKIYAVGRVVGETIYDADANKGKHWSRRIYAPISDIIILENPIDVVEFNDFIFVTRQSAITGVFGEEFEKLKELILSKNRTQKYFRDSVSVVLPLKDIDRDNWISISREYRRAFFLEEQFRTYYTNYLLRELTDNKVYRECRCKYNNKPDYFVDNVITINNHKLLVEVKLNISNEKDLPEQMDRYFNCDSVIIEGEKIPICEFVTTKAIIIDTEGIYLFDKEKKDIQKVYDLDDLTRTNEIDSIRNLLVGLMEL